MENLTLKEKIKLFFSDEKKRAIFILVCVVILLAIVIIIALCYKESHKEEVTTTTRIKHTVKKDIFKGYTIKEYDQSKTVSYNVKKNNNIKYAKGEDAKQIFTFKDDIEYFYELSLKDGLIIFKEQTYDSKKQAYEYTGNKEVFKAKNNITDFIVATTCEQDTYSILAIDDKGIIYLFDTPADEFNIKDLLSEFKEVKTISKASKVGYYDESNNPSMQCAFYELVYLDTSNNVRYVYGKNQLFFDTAYYRYIGNRDYDNFIYVLKDGLMKYDIGNNRSYLYDGNYHIKYRGSFYTIENNKENVYIIGTDGYLYLINNLTEESNIKLERVNKNTIKRIGTKTIINDQNFATELSKVKIEFSDDNSIDIDNAYAFELLN